MKQNQKNKKTKKTMETNQKPWKNMKLPWKTMETNQKPWKNHETTLKNPKTPKPQNPNGWFFENYKKFNSWLWASVDKVWSSSMFMTACLLVLMFCLLFFLSHCIALMLWKPVIIISPVLRVWRATTAAICVIRMCFLFLENATNFWLALIHVFIVNCVLRPVDMFICFQFQSDHFLLFLLAFID